MTTIRSAPVKTGWLSSVQDSIYALEIVHNYALHPVSQEVVHLSFIFLYLFFLSNVRLTDCGLFSSFLRKIVDRFLLLRLFPPGDQCCVVLGFVSAGNVSSSSILQIFRDTCDGSFARQSICSVISLCSGMSMAVTPQGVLEGGCGALTHACVGFPFLFL